MLFFNLRRTLICFNKLFEHGLELKMVVKYCYMVYIMHRRCTQNHGSNNFGVVEHVLRELRTWSSGE